MAFDIRGDKKVVYTEGTLVSFDTSGRKGKGGTKGGALGSGVIVGIASEGLIDMWIVRVAEGSSIDPKVYPYTCIVVPHTLLWADAHLSFAKVD